MPIFLMGKHHWKNNGEPPEDLSSASVPALRLSSFLTEEYGSEASFPGGNGNFGESTMESLPVSKLFPPQRPPSNFREFPKVQLATPR